uniref:Cystatin domain-containing protein n=1 Tax=Erpetoichthys calabaricus TaxID=27687 RepID=A0A8C4SP64_ERPCA
MAFGWIYTFLSVGLLAVSAEFIWSRPVHNMARFAVSEYNKDSTDLYASKLIKIISVNDDVKYILIVEIGRTQCLKMDNMDIDICPISNFDQFENMKPFYSWYIYSVCNYLLNKNLKNKIKSTCDVTSL